MRDVGVQVEILSIASSITQLRCEAEKRIPKHTIALGGAGGRKMSKLQSSKRRVD
jgi:hypothetical protein